MSARKQQHVSRDCTDTLDYTIHPLSYLCWRFTARGAIPEQLPVWAFCKNLVRAQSLILTIVPFHQVRIDFRHRSKPSQFAGSCRTLSTMGVLDTIAGRAAGSTVDFRPSGSSMVPLIRSRLPSGVSDMP